jgi:hypothetical protein
LPPGKNACRDDFIPHVEKRRNLVFLRAKGVGLSYYPPIELLQARGVTWISKQP